MSDSTNGTPHTSTTISPLEGLRQFLDLPESEREAMIASLTESERKTLRSTAKRFDLGENDEGSSVSDSTDPPFREMREDRRWIEAEIERGAFAGLAGQYVAVVRKQLLGHDPDAMKLCDEVSTHHQIDPRRIVLEYIEIEGVSVCY